MLKTLLHQGKKVELRRLIGGVVWPEQRDGYMVVVGEELFPAVGSRLHPQHILEVATGRDMGQFIASIMEVILRENLVWLVGRRSPSAMDFLHQWNHDLRPRGMPELHIDNAIGVSPSTSNEGAKIEYHLNVIKDRLRYGQRTLHGVTGDIRVEMEDIRPESIRTITDVDVPAVAALGYAVATMTRYEPEYEDGVYDDFRDTDTVDSMTGY